MPLALLKSQPIWKDFFVAYEKRLHSLKAQLLIWSHKDEKIDRKWTFMPIGVLTHKNPLISKESYNKIFDTEAIFDSDTPMDPGP